mmetsp:Transcript_8829/g.13555  ORF Transcript_8829/g.13555 Transcript_8829/m.13555 type:complete len:130 (+) Transcript_8829:1384-1773(+)
MEQHPEEIDERDDLSQRRLLYEDAWMQVQGPTSEFRLNLNQSAGPLFHHLSSASENFSTRTTVGTDRDFLWGFLLGFFVGFLMLVWVWMPTVPHKQKLGILTGISVQLALSVFHSNDQGGDDELDLEGV